MQQMRNTINRGGLSTASESSAGSYANRRSVRRVVESDSDHDDDYIPSETDFTGDLSSNPSNQRHELYRLLHMTQGLHPNFVRTMLSQLAGAEEDNDEEEPVDEEEIDLDNMDEEEDEDEEDDEDDDMQEPRANSASHPMDTASITETDEDDYGEEVWEDVDDEDEDSEA
jgi:hypothetical protein